ncbi:MAG: hypothetical protein J6Z14_05685 [Prevotella sp.]|nr:hypothetical protein [Prevotella sp.]
MEATVRKRRTTHPISHYWSLVKDMDDSQKKELAIMIIESIKPAEVEPKKSRKKKLDIDDIYGGWSDDYFMDADEMVKLLKESRHFKDRTKFWDEL